MFGLFWRTFKRHLFIGDTGGARVPFYYLDEDAEGGFDSPLAGRALAGISECLHADEVGTLSAEGVAAGDERELGCSIEADEALGPAGTAPVALFKEDRATYRATYCALALAVARECLLEARALGLGCAPVGLQSAVACAQLFELRREPRGGRRARRRRRRAAAAIEGAFAALVVLVHAEQRAHAPPGRLERGARLVQLARRLAATTRGQG